MTPHPNHATRAPRTLVLGCLAVTWFVWGSMYLAIKWSLDAFPPFLLMGSQFVAAGLLLGGACRLRGAPWPRAAQWLGAVVLGALLLGGGYGFTALAETQVGSGLVVAFGAIVPTLIAIAEVPYGRKPGRRQAAGIVIGLAGIVLLTQGKGFGASPLGLLYITLACVTWVIGSVWAIYGLPGGRALRCAPGLMGCASQMFAGGLLLLGAAQFAGETLAWPPPAAAAWSWLYLMFAGSLAGYTAYMLLLEHTSATLAASYTYVNPVVALALGIWLDGERVSAMEFVAIGAVLAGVVLLLWAPAPAPTGTTLAPGEGATT